MSLRRVSIANTDATAVFGDEFYPRLLQYLLDPAERSFAQFFTALETNDGLR